MLFVVSVAKVFVYCLPGWTELLPAQALVYNDFKSLMNDSADSVKQTTNLKCSDAQHSACPNSLHNPPETNSDM
jgi:hypothetical protein